MTSDLLQQKYVVIATKQSGYSSYFKKLVNCNYDSIVKWVESLAYGDEVELNFFPMKALNSDDVMDLTHDDVRTLKMNNYKSMDKFREEIDEITNELSIKVEKDQEIEDQE